jgi:phenylalanyl-tRNA synthetase alpha chain
MSIRDLTDPAEGLHAMQMLVGSLASSLGSDVRIVRGPHIVSVADNYDRLRIPREAVTRDTRYTRYVSPDEVWRTHTSAMIPAALRELARDASWSDVVLLAPGIVYRRDCIDRLHTGEPHQMDVWRIARHPLGEEDLLALIATVVSALCLVARGRRHPRFIPTRSRGVRSTSTGSRSASAGSRIPRWRAGSRWGSGSIAS